MHHDQDFGINGTCPTNHPVREYRNYRAVEAAGACHDCLSNDILPDIFLALIQDFLHLKHVL